MIEREIIFSFSVDIPHCINHIVNSTLDSVARPGLVELEKLLILIQEYVSSSEPFTTKLRNSEYNIVRNALFDLTRKGLNPGGKANYFSFFKKDKHFLYNFHNGPYPFGIWMSNLEWINAVRISKYFGPTRLNRAVLEKEILKEIDLFVDFITKNYLEAAVKASSNIPIDEKRFRTMLRQTTLEYSKLSHVQLYLGYYPEVRTPIFSNSFLGFFLYVVTPMVLISICFTTYHQYNEAVAASPERTGLQISFFNLFISIFLEYFFTSILFLAMHVLIAPAFYSFSSTGFPIILFFFSFLVLVYNFFFYMHIKEKLAEKYLKFIFPEISGDKVINWLISFIKEFSVIFWFIIGLIVALIIMYIAYLYLTTNNETKKDS